MKTDAEGTLWMHTGDEGIIDEEGYLRGTIFAFSKRQGLLTCSVSGWQDQSMNHSSLLNLINLLTAL
jgi:acyl-CoA synthetase (AMP-forming)/AMP-acid ligase II